MPRLLIPLGIAVLIALTVALLLGGGDSANETRDGTREGSWPSGDAARAEREPARAPTLKGSGKEASTLGVDPASAEAGPPEPTGPYEFLVVAFESEALLVDVEITDEEGEPLGKTDHDGALLLEDAGVSELVFSAAKDGYVTHRGRALPGRVTLVVLQPGVSIRGRVVRFGSGRPVADASIIVWDDDLEREIAAVATNEEGHFLLRAIRPNHPVQIIVRTDGLVPHVRREMFHVALKDYEITVGDGGRLLGAVSTPEEKPLAGVEVRLLHDGEPIVEQRHKGDRRARARARLAGTRTAVTHTNEKGMYLFRGVGLNQWVRPAAVIEPRFVVLPEGGRGHTFRDSGTWRIDIVVAQPAALRIRIEDEKRAPIGHADVHLRTDRGQWPLVPADAHEEGGYLVKDLAPERAYVTAALPGAPPQQGDVRLVAGQQSEILLTFPIGRGLQGVVRDKRGEPIWKALVSWRGDTKDEVAATRTDDKGRFALSRLVSATGTLSIGARDLPYTSRSYEGKELEDLAPGPTPLEITLLDGTRAFGTFEDLPKGAIVTSTIAGGSRYEEIDHHLKPDGRFERRGPRPRGKGCVFVFRTRGYPPLLVKEPRPFDSEEVRDLGPLLFEATNPRLGRIVDGGKRPVHGAQVRITTPWSSRSTRTDIDGDFALPRLPDERIPIEIRAEGFPPTPATLETTSQFRRQVFFIRRTGALMVEVGWSSMERPRRVLVRLRAKPPKGWRRGDPAPLEITRPLGKRKLTRFHVPPGRYLVLAVDGDQRLMGGRDVEVKAGGHQQVVELVLQRAR